MEICFELDGRTVCIPIYVEVERHWPPVPPEERFHLDDLLVEDPSWWQTAFAVATIDRMATEVAGDFSAQLRQVAAVGLESLQASLPGGARLNLSTRVASTA